MAKVLHLFVCLIPASGFFFFFLIFKISVNHLLELGDSVFTIMEMSTWKFERNFSSRTFWLVFAKMFRIFLHGKKKKKIFFLQVKDNLGGRTQ